MRVRDIYIYAVDRESSDDDVEGDDDDDDAAGGGQHWRRFDPASSIFVVALASSLRDRVVYARVCACVYIHLYIRHDTLGVVV